MVPPIDVPIFMENRKFYTEYAGDILNTLFNAENNKINIRFLSDQLDIRPDLIDVIKQFSKHQGYSLATLHLAVYILDLYMDCYILSESSQHQRLIALVAILLAAKSEDLDELVPSIKDLLKIVDMSVDLGVDLRFISELDPKVVTTAFRDFRNMYCRIEFLVFESLDFNCCRPTVISFLNVFQNLVVTEADVTDIKPETRSLTLGDLRVSSNQYLQQFCDILLDDIKFVNVLSSALAAAMIGATRKLLNIEHYWNDELTKLTSYKVTDIRHLMIMLIEKRMSSSDDSDRDILMKDSGFLSFNSGSETDENEIDHIIKKQRICDIPDIADSIA